jgi:hypothetical protein
MDFLQTSRRYTSKEPNPNYDTNVQHYFQVDKETPTADSRTLRQSVPYITGFSPTQNFKANTKASPAPYCTVPKLARA